MRTSEATGAATANRTEPTAGVPSDRIAIRASRATGGTETVPGPAMRPMEPVLAAKFVDWRQYQSAPSGPTRQSEISWKPSPQCVALGWPATGGAMAHEPPV